MTNNFVFETDMAAKTIHIAREFNAPVEKVWRAWTEADLLEKWIAPKPWTAKTKIMDFTVGGIWLYAMVGTEGQKHWVYAKFTAIENGSAFSSTGMFCDGEGNPVVDGPKSYRDTKFTTVDGNRTRVDSVITFEEESTIKMFAQGGFKEGTTMTFSQLDEFLTIK
ncbi:SRPBCC family protein [Mucilaginibacter gilvus]|uniref:SRPBCC domain-containing protein n=1 Tax=Mucilaginibacter gilvus TaxID=2305909 RepID=A0A444MV82_9SPHI|nr:SRPBCC domain-containing protein [Mucilaginibacter gilvus]RWY57508.1 SRPBCC domain-containing protein [Mucilaginibacter gilvus]